MPLLGSSARITLGQSPRQPRGSDPRFPSSPVPSPHTDRLNLEGKSCILGTHLPVLQIGQLPPGGAGQGHSDGNGSASGAPQVPGSSGALVPDSRLILERLPVAMERPLGRARREGRGCVTVGHPFSPSDTCTCFSLFSLLVTAILPATCLTSLLHPQHFLGCHYCPCSTSSAWSSRLSKTTTLDREPRRLASCVDS